MAWRTKTIVTHFGQVGFSCLESETIGGDIPAPLGRDELVLLLL